MKVLTAGFGVALAVGVAGVMFGQELPAIGDLSAPHPARAREHVAFLPEAQVVPAKRSEAIALHFAVEDGFHINSHQPRAETLIATELRLEPSAGVTVGRAEYPAGRPYSFAASPGDVLDVYSGEFRVTLPVTAAAGAHTLKGVLRYQACDRAMCYPVRSLPVEVEFTAK